MDTRATIDFETRSAAGWPRQGPGKKAGLPVVGVEKYVRHPSFLALCLAYHLPGMDDVDLRALPGSPEGTGSNYGPPSDLYDYIRSGGIVEAHNVGFERWVWELYMVPRLGAPAIHPHQWRCSAAKARAFGLPGGLDALCKALGVAGKDPAGDLLIRQLCNPQKDGAFRTDPDKHARLHAYCREDVRAEMRASALVPDLSPADLEYWRVHEDINRRGVAVDLQTVEAGQLIIADGLERAGAELRGLTGGAVSAPSEVAASLRWLKEAHALELASLDEDAVSEALLDPFMAEAPRRLLEIRQQFGSAAVKKFNSMHNRTDHETGRAYDTYIAGGARTGRSTGDGIQPTNLPKDGISVHRCECGRSFGTPLPSCPYCGTAAPTRKPEGWGRAAQDDAIEVLRTGSLPYVEYIYGEGRAFDVLKSSVRGMFWSPDSRLIVGDWSAIEAVGLAMLAQEPWRIEVFRTHGKIYEMSASKISGVPFDDILAHKRDTGEHHPLRGKVGKVCELALGYGGAVGSMRAFGAGEFMTEDEMLTAVRAWRAASPNVVSFWWDLDRAFVKAIQLPGFVHPVRSGVAVQGFGRFVQIILPSGRRMTYWHPSYRDRTIRYWTWNTNPKYGRTGWVEMDTYGPKLAENVIQGACNDLMRHASIQEERAGYPVVMHVYDEIVVESDKDPAEFARIMADPPMWAKDWPIRVGGDYFAERRYRK